MITLPFKRDTRNVSVSDVSQDTYGSGYNFANGQEDFLIGKNYSNFSNIQLSFQFEGVNDPTPTPGEFFALTSNDTQSPADSLAIIEPNSVEIEPVAGFAILNTLFFGGAFIGFRFVPNDITQGTLLNVTVTAKRT